MSAPSKGQPILAAGAFNDLQKAKREILEAVVGKVPDSLLLATALAAVRLARRQAAPGEVLSDRVLDLVRESLKGLSQPNWKPETALLLKKRLGERHGISQ